ncbi:hypothetical protein DY000_02039201 [Brassica cretica]|uniref:Protein FRA10AC1 n=1 Tax=Brassica cretica TaxID=69181 RepID=A0ABQ7BIN7_BRACR|nr:hypothetical protein DY000_02039201 [Brassica cretica]
MASSATIRSEIYDREERKQQYQAHIRGLNAYERHKKFLKDYGTLLSPCACLVASSYKEVKRDNELGPIYFAVRFYGKDKPTEVKLPLKTDHDTLREGYRFIRSEEDDLNPSWEQRLVKRYYDKLFKEYCIADMSRYKTGQMGLRWRTEKEVMSGKGQFMCGSKQCHEIEGLASYEASGEHKQALVKLVTCERNRSSSEDDIEEEERRKGVEFTKLAI